MENKSSTNNETIIGVISDTHGFLPSSLLQALAGVDMIIHAGDLDTPEILLELEKIAPVKAVAGNTDIHPKLQQLPSTQFFDVGGVLIYIIHDLLHLNIDLPTAGVQVLIHGHLHVPEIQQRNGVLFTNPGSPTSPRRGTKPGYVRLTIQDQMPTAEWIALS